MPTGHSRRFAAICENSRSSSLSNANGRESTQIQPGSPAKTKEKSAKISENQRSPQAPSLDLSPLASIFLAFPASLPKDAATVRFAVTATATHPLRPMNSRARSNRPVPSPSFATLRRALRKICGGGGGNSLI